MFHFRTLRDSKEPLFHNGSRLWPFSSYSTTHSRILRSIEVGASATISTTPS